MKATRSLIIPICLLSLLFLSSCQMKRQVETSHKEAGTSSSENIQYEIINAENNKGDIDKIIEKFTGDTLEEAVKNGAVFEKSYGEDSVTYEKGTKSFSYTGKSREGLGPVITYKDQYEMAGEQYETLLSFMTSSLKYNLIGTNIRKQLPDESLDNCTKEEVINYCNPYAELLGYSPDNSLTEVYALTAGKIKDESITCYGPLKGINNKKALSSDELHRIEEKYPWTKEYEALYVVYKPYTNGLLFDSSYCCLQMVYVPVYGKIVYLFGEMPWTVKEKSIPDKLISKEDAIAEAMLLSNTANKDNIKIEDVTMVYSQNIVHLRENNGLDLCWRVDFKVENSAMYQDAMAYQSVLVNAVTGEECVMWPGLND